MKVVGSNTSTITMHRHFFIDLLKKIDVCCRKDENKLKRGLGWTIYKVISGSDICA